MNFPIINGIESLKKNKKMRIEPIKISITDQEDDYASFMYISASDSWGNEEENSEPAYEAIALLKDKNGIIKKRLKISLIGEDYEKWDGTNQSVLQMFLDKYSWLKLI